MATPKKEMWRFKWVVAVVIGVQKILPQQLVTSDEYLPGCWHGITAAGGVCDQRAHFSNRLMEV